MAKWSFSNVNWTPTATADTINLANNTYQGILGGSATQRLEIMEVYIAGMAGASSPTFLQLARNSVIGASTCALVAPATAGPLDTATAALAAAPNIYTAATTAPQRSVSTALARLNLGLNAFGGIVRWVAAVREEYIVYGTAVNAGDASLSAYTGGTVGAINSHIIFEPL